MRCILLQCAPPARTALVASTKSLYATPVRIRTRQMKVAGISKLSFRFISISHNSHDTVRIFSQDAIRAVHVVQINQVDVSAVDTHGEMAAGVHVRAPGAGQRDGESQGCKHSKTYKHRTEVYFFLFLSYRYIRVPAVRA